MLVITMSPFIFLRCSGMIMFRIKRKRDVEDTRKYLRNFSGQGRVVLVDEFGGIAAKQVDHALHCRKYGASDDSGEAVAHRAQARAPDLGDLLSATATGHGYGHR